MVNSKGKLRGKGPPKQVEIMSTAGWVEPGDKWMMETRRPQTTTVPARFFFIFYVPETITPFSFVSCHFKC